MLDQGPVARRYTAFISYSRHDSAFASRIHRRLESYVLPRRLMASPTSRRDIPRKLSPIFRDKDELPAAENLSDAVRAALLQSDTLVVICSPAAARSLWVAREIEVFRELHPTRPILAALIDGEPAQAFPPPLTPGDSEPLAADFRRGGDGNRLALLKLAAGITGVELDDLVQRDAQSRVARVMAVTAVSVAGMLAMSIATTLAVQSRMDAERQRAKAERLVDFMLTDLRSEMEKMGRLGAQTEVDRLAFEYYSDQDLRKLGPASLDRRARALHLLGRDDQDAGRFDAATAKFREAWKISDQLVRNDPGNSDRLLTYASIQSSLGEIALKRGDRSGAQKWFAAYHVSADRLLKLRPNDPKVLRELAFAKGSVCVLEHRTEPKAGVADCLEALRLMEKAVSLSGAPGKFAAELANRHAWLADTYREVGDRDSARRHRGAEEEILSVALKADPDDMTLNLHWSALQRAYAILDYDAGRYRSALDRLMKARATLERMTRIEPTNVMWQSRLRQSDQDLAFIRSRLN
ncbi:tetratricopeptide (TPR) repeat protein [Caulobacter ginsengisoli]|uniref:Tetratricopeptide (TPR) repeat protein n=1 Tax=Caulobacter ginsengisoli TaxID=400775 RepID=A0ABU0ILU2_9CAUL|nr:TIR domain-containing protein [Caulobacter ginsengisoli]MDQ0462934.1 tetratricopeptide (TPR) repeat protein [Caulobacter ginsengisoli]